jgi:hypothetical protein
VATQKGLEPSTSSVTGWHSNQLNYCAVSGGNNRARTCDPLLVRQMLSQLSYAPVYLSKRPFFKVHLKVYLIQFWLSTMFCMGGFYAIDWIIRRVKFPVEEIVKFIIRSHAAEMRMVYFYRIWWLQGPDKTLHEAGRNQSSGSGKEISMIPQKVYVHSQLFSRQVLQEPRL